MDKLTFVILLLADCVLYAVGKPVFHHATESAPPHGWWMRDPNPRTEIDGEKYWATKQNEDNLYEYANKEAFRSGTPN